MATTCSGSHKKELPLVVRDPAPLPVSCSHVVVGTSSGGNTNSTGH
jgi:hypothetical protein